MSKERKGSNKGNDEGRHNIEEELERQLELQNQIHKTCKMKGDTEEKQKKWKEKYS